MSGMSLKGERRKSTRQAGSTVLLVNTGTHKVQVRDMEYFLKRKESSEKKVSVGNSCFILFYWCPVARKSSNVLVLMTIKGILILNKKKIRLSFLKRL